jgi:NDP-sugar pyrophosphorylase family protein
MKAMILAAGLGTRLRPLTDHRPKALVAVAGRTMLEIALARLRSFGVRDVIVEYLQAHDNFGMRIEVSREDVLLDTGGGLKKAAHFFFENSSGAETPFILHNVDVISTIDFQKMLQFHADRRALATLAVQKRETSRLLLFDQSLQLCGRRPGGGQPDEIIRSAQPMQELAFCGIHFISARLLAMMTEEGAFSIICSYLRLASAGETIAGFRADEYYWRDLGKPADLLQAAEDLKQKALP